MTRNQKLRVRATLAGMAQAGDWFLGRKSRCLHQILEVLPVRDSVVVTYQGKGCKRTRRYPQAHQFLKVVGL